MRLMGRSYRFLSSIHDFVLFFFTEREDYLRKRSRMNTGELVQVKKRFWILACTDSSFDSQTGLDFREFRFIGHFSLLNRFFDEFG